MKASIAIPVALAFAVLMAGCSSHRLAEQNFSKPVVPLATNDHQASLTFRTKGGAGDNPVTYSLAYADSSYGLAEAGERVYDGYYFSRVPGYLKKIGGGTDSIDKVIEANKPLRIHANVKQQIATLNGIPVHSMFGYAITAQPATQVFTPQPKKNYLIETVIGDAFVMSIYEVTATGERKPVEVTVATD